MEQTNSRTFITLTENKLGARIFCTNLFLGKHEREILYITGFGPTQEVRAFAQLMARESEMEVVSQDGSCLVSSYGVTTKNQVWIAKGPEGQALLYSVPRHMNMIFAESEQSAKRIYNRLLEQQAFVLQSWFEYLFSELPRLTPHVGSLFGCITHRDIQSRVKEGLLAGEFSIPGSTASFSLKKTNEEESSAVA